MAPLESRIRLESLAPLSLRWVQGNQGEAPLRVRRRHDDPARAAPLRRGAPRHVHGHQSRRGHWRVYQPPALLKSERARVHRRAVPRYPLGPEGTMIETHTVKLTLGT